MDNIAFEGRLTEADFRKINGLAGRKLRRFFYGLILVIFILTAIPYRHTPFYFLYHFSPVFLIFFAIILLGYLQTKHAWRKSSIGKLPFKGAVSEEGITWNTEGVSSANMGWHLFLHYRESGPIILVYFGVNQVLYFLRRFFTSDADWASFRDMLSKKLRRK
jgi:hypothetical protein